MKQYLLSIYQPDGDPPPPEVLEPIMRDIEAVNGEMRAAGAWLFTGGTVSRDDLRLLAYLGETHQEIELLREKVPQILGIS